MLNMITPIEKIVAVIGIVLFLFCVWCGYMAITTYQQSKDFIPDVEPVTDIYDEALAAILWRESRNGEATGLDVPGPDGELGDWQITPIWRADIERLFGEQVDPMDAAKTRGQAERWLRFYSPRVGAETVEDMCEMWRRGPTGFKRYKERNDG